MTGTTSAGAPLMALTGRVPEAPAAPVAQAEPEVPAIPLAPEPVHTGALFITRPAAPVPASTPAHIRALQADVAKRARKGFAARGPLSVAAFFFAAGLAVTSVVPMLALGQSSTAAAATAVGVQDPGQVQQWQAAMTGSGPAASLDALRLAEGDLKAVGRIAEIVYAEADELAVTDIELTPQEA